MDKHIFGLTGSQWTGLTLPIVCTAVLAVWAIRPGRHEPPAAEAVEPDAVRDVD